MTAVEHKRALKNMMKPGYPGSKGYKINCPYCGRFLASKIESQHEYGICNNKKCPYYLKHGYKFITA